MTAMPARAVLLATRSDDGSGGEIRHEGLPQVVRPAVTVPARRRGRPPLCTPQQVLAEIRAEAAGERLLRVHLDRPALYARARRLWGSWARALHAAGLDAGKVREAARRHAVETRRRRRAGATV